MRGGVALKTYVVNEIFYSLQGEGVRAGTANVFLRFAGCNRACSVQREGFRCDTEFATGRELTLSEIVSELRSVAGKAMAGKDVGADNTIPLCEWVLLTGGEPALQVDRELIDALHDAGFKLAIETNGSIELPDGLDWITVSPKGSEEAIRQKTANEVKYVRAYGQPIPQTSVQEGYQLISPAFDGERLDPNTLQWCIRLVRENPPWRLSIQLHKLWGIR